MYCCCCQYKCNRYPGNTHLRNYLMSSET